MRIRRLQVRDLRRYRELDIDLAPGVTVVRGPNEAGKSTIQRAIELALTRRVTSSAGDLESLRPWDASADTRMHGDQINDKRVRHRAQDRGSGELMPDPLRRPARDAS